MTEPQTLHLSKKALIRSTLLALALATVTLVLFILPAEYNIDPTGLGKTIGLTQLSPSSLDAPVKAKQANKEQASGYQKDQVVIEVPAGEGLEYKFYMDKHQNLTYHWSTTGEELYFDLHGEPEGDTTGYFESYTVSNANEVQGAFITPFAGSHGWYWKNNSDQNVTVTLNTEGKYKLIGFVH